MWRPWGVASRGGNLLGPRDVLSSPLSCSCRCCVLLALEGVSCGRRRSCVACGARSVVAGVLGEIWGRPAGVGGVTLVVIWVGDVVGASGGALAAVCVRGSAGPSTEHPSCPVARCREELPAGGGRLEGRVGLELLEWRRCVAGRVGGAEEGRVCVNRAHGRTYGCDREAGKRWNAAWA